MSLLGETDGQGLSQVIPQCVSNPSQEVTLFVCPYPAASSPRAPLIDIGLGCVSVPSRAAQSRAESCRRLLRKAALWMRLCQGAAKVEHDAGNTGGKPLKVTHPAISMLASCLSLKINARVTLWPYSDSFEYTTRRSRNMLNNTLFLYPPPGGDCQAVEKW